MSGYILKNSSDIFARTEAALEFINKLALFVLGGCENGPSVSRQFNTSALAQDTQTSIDAGVAVNSPSTLWHGSAPLLREADDGAHLVGHRLDIPSRAGLTLNVVLRSIGAQLGALHLGQRR